MNNLQNKFKVGDLVTCTSSFSNLEFGKTLTVVKVNDDGNYIKVPDSGWIHCSNFKLVKTETEFCMKENAWFIRPNNEQEWKVAVEFVKSKGFSFQYDSHYESGLVLTNRCVDNRALYGGLYKMIRSRYTEGKEEIKLSYKTVLDKVQYPEVKSGQQLEIEEIEAEMRKLADRLNKIKGE